MTPFRLHLGGLCVLGLILIWPAVGHASATFPTELQQDWGLPSTPDCTLCHSSDLGGTGTVTTPFGRSLLEQGTMGMDNGSLRAALAVLKADNTDSDGDGVSDYDELRMGLSPNDGPGANAFPLPQTGCALRPGRSAAPPVDGWGLLSAAAVVLAVRKRRDRR